MTVHKLGVFEGLLDRQIRAIVDAFGKPIKWVPIMKLGGVTAVTANTDGIYIRIGDIVFIRGYISVTNKNGGTGAAIIEGLPFQVPSLVVPYASASLYIQGGALVPGAGNQVQLNLNNKSIDINKVAIATGIDVVCTEVDIATTGAFWFTAVYPAV